MSLPAPFGRLGICLCLTGILIGCEQAPESTADLAVPQSAQRIISLAPNLTELSYAAGAGDRLVGVVEYSDYPEAALSLPRVGDSFRVDYEIVNSLQPDLLLAWESGNPAEVIDRLQELGYRVVTLETTDLDSIAEQIVFIGTLAGTANEASRAADLFRQQLAELNDGMDVVPVSVFWQISASPYFSITGQHVIDEIIRMCGGRNIFADLPGLAPPITLEAILAKRPEVIIASAKDDLWKQDWAQWSELPAVRDGQLYSVDPDLVSRSGPRIVEGAKVVCAAIADARN
jgi:iron complex transport system substrate-binding protein